MPGAGFLQTMLAASGLLEWLSLLVLWLFVYTVKGPSWLFGTPGTIEGRWQDGGGAAIPLCSDGEVGIGHPDAHMPSLLPAGLGFVWIWAGGICVWRPWVAALCDPSMSPPNCVIKDLCALWEKSWAERSRSMFDQ